MKIISQRHDGDCVIAALATVLRKSYEEMAALIEIELDASGKPVGIDKLGLALGEVVPALVGIGLAPVVFTSTLAALSAPINRPVKFLSPDELRKRLIGQRAIVVVAVEHDGHRYGHAMPWLNDAAVDYQHPERARLPIVEALVLFERKTGNA